MDSKNNKNYIEQEKRRRQLAQLKASNQMLREAMETAMSHTDDVVKQDSLRMQFEKAFEDNRLQAERFLQATEADVENATFREVDKSEVEKYNRRLAEKGLTDADMRRKDIATVTTSKSKKGKKTNRRVRLGSEKDTSEIERLENEEELMKQTMVKNDEEIEMNRKRNDEILEEMRRNKLSLFRSAKTNFPQQEETPNKVEVKKPAAVENVIPEPVKQKAEKPLEKTTVVEKPKKAKKKASVEYSFDFSSIPYWVQYDVIPLPSNGQCYPEGHPLRCGRIPVAYLTASDENVMSSPNVWRDGKLFDILLERKILDPRIDIDEINSGDKDAIILWLRATSYGDEIALNARDPKTGKQYDATVSLSQFDYREFNLEGDEDGLFDYTAENGDVIKFKYLTNGDEGELRDSITSQIADFSKMEAVKSLGSLTQALAGVEVEDDEREMLNEDLEEIRHIIGDDITTSDNVTFPTVVTEQMVLQTVSVNGNDDPEFVRHYVENMRTKVAMSYRNYVAENKPGVDFSFEVNIPESEGGGSFETFLRLEDSIFLYL